MRYGKVIRGGVWHILKKDPHIGNYWNTMCGIEAPERDEWGGPEWIEGARILVAADGPVCRRCLKAKEYPR